MADQVQQKLTPGEQRRANPERVLTFTDGVFAIIITILVLELEVPDLGSGQSLSASLAEMRPTMIAFVISFLLVGMYWALHRTMFADVRYVNTKVVWLNLLFLLPTSMIPFAASVVGEYENNATALHLYGTVLILATLTRTALYWYLARHPGLLWEPMSRQSRRLGGIMAVGPVLVYAIAIAVADIMPRLSVVIYFALPLLYLGMVAVLKTDPRTKVAAADLS